MQKTNTNNTNNSANDRLNELKAVSNQAQKAYPDYPRNKAIEMFKGLNPNGCRFYRQAIAIGLTNEQISELPNTDVWGANTEAYCQQTGAPRFYPQKVFDCSRWLKKDGTKRQKPTK